MRLCVVYERDGKKLFKQFHDIKGAQRFANAVNGTIALLSDRKMSMNEATEKGLDILTDDKEYEKQRFRTKNMASLS